jgi:hypothetical protein
MDIERGWSDQVNEGLMSCLSIFMGVDQFLKPVPAALGAVSVNARTFAWPISRLTMRFACFSLANSGDCSPSFWSQTHRIHSEGMMTFGPESTAQMKPSKVETSIALSRPSSASRNAHERLDVT